MASKQPERQTFKIGEVCRIADLQPYVLRYWETEFLPLAPAKGGGGQRAYTQREIDIILRIKELLYSEGFTIAGAKKKLEHEIDDHGALKSDAKDRTSVESSGEPASIRTRALLEEVRRDLKDLLNLLG